MVAPWQETPDKVVVEFKRSGRGRHRVIELSHAPGSMPPQLAQRGVPSAVWDALAADAGALAASHPYTAKPQAGDVARWACCFALLSVIGFGLVEPDAGDWGAWLSQAEAVVARHAPTFAPYGVALSLARAQGSYWIQADCLPAVAAGVPIVMPPPKAA
jgi:hypothetical protein